MSTIFDFYKAEIATKKTAASKKAFLTKSLNQCENHLKDLIKHQKPTGNMKFGYLHGEPVTAIRIKKVKVEIQYIIMLRNQIK